MRHLVLSVLAAFVLTGCGVLATVSEDRNQLAVQYATLKVIDSPDVDAARVVELVSRARAFVDDGASVTVSALADAARERLASSGLDVADKLLIDAILTRAQARLETEIGGGLLSSDQRVQLVTVLGWIEDAAKQAEK